MKTLAVARIRAVLGVGFAVLGIVIGVELLLRPEPLTQKLLGLGFALVLVALGVVRVRGYLALRRAAP